MKCDDCLKYGYFPALCTCICNICGKLYVSPVLTGRFSICSECSEKHSLCENCGKKIESKDKNE